MADEKNSNSSEEEMRLKAERDLLRRQEEEQHRLIEEALARREEEELARRKKEIELHRQQELERLSEERNRSLVPDNAPTRIPIKKNTTESRFDKGIRQIQYEKHLEESESWMEELSLEKIDTTETKSQPAVAPEASTEGKVIELKKRKRRRTIPLAAAATVLLLISAFFLLQPENSDNERYALAANEAFAVPELLATRGGSVSDAAFEQALQLYIQEDYPAAKASLQELQANTPDDGRVRFLLGLLDLRAQNYAAAIPHFTFAREHANELTDLNLGPPIAFREAGRADADWYLALAYLGDGQVEEARGLLAEITIEEDHPFKLKAFDLEKKLTSGG